ncbi:MAG: hypothetical protein K8L97_33940 [Anaerolineae bacterium]|nr:hypothetical protein [Anaerolineae bacterium]
MRNDSQNSAISSNSAISQPDFVHFETEVAAMAAVAAWRKLGFAAKKLLAFSHQPLVHTEDCVCVTFMSQMSRKMSVLRGNVVNVIVRYRLSEKFTSPPAPLRTGEGSKTVCGDCDCEMGLRAMVDCGL